ncbi:MAG: signal peptidase I [Actinobacteria bacterium]|nr:signal peptidase I [Actinomycetota bacterium]
MSLDLGPEQRDGDTDLLPSELPVVFRHRAASSDRPGVDAADRDDDDELEDADDGRTMRRVGWFVGVIVVLLLVQTFLVEAVRVRSDSMSPSYQAADVVMVDKITYRFRDPRIDEVVVTEDPRTGQTIVKRVVAVGGDSIGIDDGRLLRNGQVVFDANIDNDNMDGYFHGPVIVPEGEVFLLGDNRDTSLDSRSFGSVPVDDVQGRVVGHVWPIGGH